MYISACQMKYVASLASLVSYQKQRKERKQHYDKKINQDRKKEANPCQSKVKKKIQLENCQLSVIKLNSGKSCCILAENFDNVGKRLEKHQ